MVQQHKNSVIFRDPDGDEYLQDLTKIGTYYVDDTSLTIIQENHGFAVGDALCYNLIEQKYQLAIALNTKDSEVCGVVKHVFDNNTFNFVTKGKIENTKYEYPEGSELWLSEAIDGHLTSIEPRIVFKKVGTQLANKAIKVEIERGFSTGEPIDQSLLEAYTQAELDEIIANINSI